MIAERMITVFLLTLSNVAMGAAQNVKPQPAKPTPVSVQGSWAGIKLMNQMIRQYEYDFGSRFITFAPRDSNQVPGALTKHECDVGMMLDSLASNSERDFEDKFETFPIGRLVVHVAVSAKHPMRTITLEELRDGDWDGQTASSDGPRELTYIPEMDWESQTFVSDAPWEVYAGTDTFEATF